MENPFSPSQTTLLHPIETTSNNGNATKISHHNLSAVLLVQWGGRHYRQQQTVLCFTSIHMNRLGAINALVSRYHMSSSYYILNTVRNYVHCRHPISKIITGGNTNNGNTAWKFFPLPTSSYRDVT